MKKRSLGIIAVIFALLLASCGSKDATGNSKDVKQEITVNVTTEPPSLDPALATDNKSGWILDHLFEGLYTKDQKGNPVLGIAEEVDTSKDMKTYTFKLRDDAKWSDGTPVTANDFEYAWKRVLNPETGSELAFYLYYLKGAEAYNQGKGSEKEVGVEALDEKTLKVELEAPVGFFDKLLSHWSFYPVKKDLVEGDKNWAAEADGYVGNGPFKMTEWKHDSSVSIEKSDEYYDADQVNLKKINFAMIADSTTYYQMYTTGELDMIMDLPSDMVDAQRDNDEFQAPPFFGTYMYMFNVEKEPFTNEKVRRAFAMALDREALTKNVTKAGEIPAYAMVPEGVETPEGDFRTLGGNYFSEEKDEAKKLLKEGMKEEGWDTLPQVTLTYNTDENHKKVAEAVQEMLNKNLGISVKLSNQEWKTYLDTTAQRNYQMARLGWTGVFVDPAVMLDAYLGESPDNETGWINEDYDRLLAEAKIEKDEEERFELLHQAEEILMKEMPFIPVYFYTKTYLTSSNLKDVTYYHNVYPSLKWAKKTGN